MDAFVLLIPAVLFGSIAYIACTIAIYLAVLDEMKRGDL